MEVHLANMEIEMIEMFVICMIEISIIHLSVFTCVSGVLTWNKKHEFPAMSKNRPD